MNTPTTVVNDYLHRLAIDHVPLADLSSLRTLHRTHLATIPLEDLGGCEDAAGTLPGLLNRITQQRRGAPATQLNLAFAMLLVGLGFTVTPLTVTPNRLNSPRGIPRLALAVHLEADPYLVDVSGAGPDGPLLLQDKQGQAASIDGFEIRMPDGALGVRGSDGPRYRVAAARGLMDALEPDALIRSKAVRPQIGEEAPVLSIRRQRGRTTLIGDHLIETNGTARTDVLLAPNQGARVIRERFGVVPSAREERCLCARSR
ncbi:arylamine N-acetyltransferase [Curtobacterium sp. B18]|uniref:arylamine N-acetyltransferase n=1 Tax=Curtobacterium sp. B18 TaxID=95614 RepID=UPI00034B2C00|nr:arylamine N-acetyltransferase [Curtobacterium sp. B18]